MSGIYVCVLHFMFSQWNIYDDTCWGKMKEEFSDLLEDFFACRGLVKVETVLKSFHSVPFMIHVGGRWDESRTMEALTHRTRQVRSRKRAWMTLKDLQKRCHCQWTYQRFQSRLKSFWKCFYHGSKSINGFNLDLQHFEHVSTLDQDTSLCLETNRFESEEDPEGLAAALFTEKVNAGLSRPHPEFPKNKAGSHSVLPPHAFIKSGGFQKQTACPRNQQIFN